MDRTDCVRTLKFENKLTESFLKHLYVNGGNGLLWYLQEYEFHKFDNSSSEWFSYIFTVQQLSQVWHNSWLEGNFTQFCSFKAKIIADADVKFFQFDVVDYSAALDYIYHCLLPLITLAYYECASLLLLENKKYSEEVN